MTTKSLTDIHVGDHYYIIDDIEELCDILEFYPTETEIDPKIILGKLAVVLAAPLFLADDWDGCVLLSFGTQIKRCRVPLAALDRNRNFNENNESKQENTSNSYDNLDNNMNSSFNDRKESVRNGNDDSNIDNNINNNDDINIYQVDEYNSNDNSREHSPKSKEHSPRARNRWNNILSPSSSAAVKKIFFDHNSSSLINSNEIIYIRDTTSESMMVRQLAAESIQDAYR